MDGIDEDTWRKIKKKSKYKTQSESERWADIYRTLFPSADVPSPCKFQRRMASPLSATAETAALTIHVAHIVLFRQLTRLVGQIAKNVRPRQLWSNTRFICDRPSQNCSSRAWYNSLAGRNPYRGIS